MPEPAVEPPFNSEWMLCEACNYSWLRDPTRSIPTRCPECRSAYPTVIEMPAHEYYFTRTRRLRTSIRSTVIAPRRFGR